MKTIIAAELESTSALKRTRQAQIAATKSFPKTAALIRKLSDKIKLLKKQALKNYLARKKADKVKDAKKAAHKTEHHAAAKPTEHKVGVKKSHSALVILSSSLTDQILDQDVKMSDADLSECCNLESESGVSVETKGAKKEESQQLKKTLKSNPKAALHKKQMSAAMRIRENKKLRVEIKKLLETKKKLQDKAWGLYVTKMKSKKKDTTKTGAQKEAPRKTSKDEKPNLKSKDVKTATQPNGKKVLVDKKSTPDVSLKSRFERATDAAIDAKSLDEFVKKVKLRPRDAKTLQRAVADKDEALVRAVLIGHKLMRREDDEPAASVMRIGKKPVEKKAKVTLTPEQSAKIKARREGKVYLTPEQSAKIKARREGKVYLTPEQSAKIRARPRVAK